MGNLDFDLNHFMENLRACKPPYKCPFTDCGKVYKTLAGIQSHICAHDNEEAARNGGAGGGAEGSGGVSGGTGGGRTRSPSPVPFFKSPVKESLVYHEAHKKVEFEAEGRIHRFSIYDALQLVPKDQWEASLPSSALLAPVNTPPAEHPEAKREDAAAWSSGTGTADASATPTSSKGGPRGHKKKKAHHRASQKPGQVGKGDSGSGAGLDGADPGGGGGGIEKKLLLKLPEAQFREVDDYELGPAPPMPASYYRFIEKSAEELDEEVEYDMDEEDVAWLELINAKRTDERLTKIHEDQFELLMDRLEKESYFHVQTNGKDYSAPIDDDAICCVCMDGECSNTNVILFCDLCNLAVHQECYGVPYIPEGQWLCRRCLQSPSRSVECCLCPNKGGAFKQTDDGRWAHVVCGLWIPEVRFANTVFLEPIDSIDNIPPARWKLSCRVCKQRGVGACIQCHKTNCYTAFHVTCGLLAGLHMKMDTVRESSATGLSVTVRKTAFCDVHTPQDSDCKPKLDDVASLGISTPKQKARTPKKLSDPNPVPVLFRGLMNFSPQCPWEKVQEIAALISVPKKNQFFQRLMAYWTLKRQTRNGVPLIRRLQFAKATRPDKKPETPQKNAHHKKKKTENDKAIVKKAKDEFKAMLEQRKSLRRIRQDLERVRLLCELIRKREQRKRELIVTETEVVKMKLAPLACFLENLLTNLQAIDVQDIFAEPVSLDEVPDYLDHIKKPMDFLTMKNKLNDCLYSTVDDLETDFNLIVENCLSYNERDTIFFRAGVKMRDQGGSIIRQAKRLADQIGFDHKTGLHTAQRTVVQQEDMSDDKLMKEIDSFMYSEERDEMPAELHLKKLLEFKDKANLLHHPVAKVKRLKLIKQEITKTRRKLSMDKTNKAAASSGTITTKSAKNSSTNITADDEDNMALSSNKKSKATAQASSIPVVTPQEPVIATSAGGRRLRAGKEIEATPKKMPVKKGRKRAKSTTEGSPTDEQPLAKRKAVEEKTPSGKHYHPSPAKSPAGVNRRNAILFTRKKQAAVAPNGDDELKTPEKKTASSNKTKEQSQTGPDEDEEEEEGENPQPSREETPAPRELDLEDHETEIQSPMPSPAKFLPVEIPKSGPKKKGKKKRGRPRGSGPSCESPEKPTSAENPGGESPWKPKTAAPSFQEYRRGGDVRETDEDTHSESATDTHGTSEEDSAEDTDSDDSAVDPSSMTIPLEPLDLVWAKCRGYPWYPALIINPKMPRTGYLHNGVPIPVPPQDVLDMANAHDSPHYLILFFDAKRTWQWLQRDKLEPLGVDSELDKAKLVQSKKPSERKAVKKAYEDAILHRCRVTGENASVSDDNTTETDSDDGDESG
ncbi:hypothetical protein TCAL_05070 [Tigriopus californicus]|uniref:Peregrin n=1 Tax=Tigriopus californicus TaxID=6832 RepID=A0A553NTV7_TIGCA|nr:peregrin-like [Tigriopus californicus]TRY68864.1 hypothetical protein TCAL_05070 [Tigriopus californicus]|eukprot:TCALIF_05070-PA protein Name:"Similar to BRPF1 Peregrin (Homo sapiens)" AED:0.30 eAED:0.30 QI:0/-1/0/1/-1/1/1/0/1349